MSEHRPRVKICGHTTVEDLRASVAAGADAVGVIAAVDVDTPRDVSLDRAAELLDAVPPGVTGVLVTMPEDVARAVELVGRTSPDAIQVHGTLSPAEIAELRERVHVDVIAAVDAEEPELPAYGVAADAVLVDTPAADGGGGTGQTHDWERTREAAAGVDAPLVLAGGLTPENVADAVETVAPFGVDVASGVEVDGGVKDHEAVAAFVESAQSTTVDAETVTLDAADGNGAPDDQHAPDIEEKAVAEATEEAKETAGEEDTAVEAEEEKEGEAPDESADRPTTEGSR